jgi:uncharacterized integral membrane protein
MQVESQPKQALPHTEPVEPRSERLRRHGHRTGLYTLAFSLVALLVVLIALVVANTRQVKLSWVAGSGHASLVWIILASAVIGWLLGIVTSVVFRLRTRRRRRPTGSRNSPVANSPGNAAGMAAAGREAGCA